jgi:hypothetical protein
MDYEKLWNRLKDMALQEADDPDALMSSRTLFAGVLKTMLDMEKSERKEYEEELKDG